MPINTINPRLLVISFFIIIIAAFRILINMNGPLSPLANFSPIGAMALFGGTYFKSQRKSFMFPLLTLFISDVILSITVHKQFGNGLLYGGWYWVYGALSLMVLAGRFIIKEVRFKYILISIFTVTFIHWIVSDMGVWLQGTTYSKNAAGLWACLLAAIPFERNFLAGTMFYSGLMFGSFEWLQRKYASLSLA
jgi:hypothetical protein